MASFLNGLHSLMTDDDEDVGLPPPTPKPTSQKEKPASTRVTKPKSMKSIESVDDDSDDFMMFSAPKAKKRDPENSWFDDDDDDSNISLSDMIKSMKENPIDDLPLDDDFDTLFSGDSDDTALENNLIAQGRAYARKNAADAELGEIEKVFAPQQRALQNLISEIDADSKGVQRDIDGLRMSRTRNTKSLADLVSAKGSLASTKLSAIKELSSIQKTIIDTNMKLKAADKTATLDNDSEAAFAVQKLLSSSNIMDSVGGLTTVSGAFHDGEDTSSHDSDIARIQSDDEMEAKYVGDDDSEGDKYIKYENSGVKLHLQVYPDGSQAVVAIDKDGNEVPDYPLPPNVENFKFAIHDDLGTASDHANREYVLDRIGSDEN